MSGINQPISIVGTEDPEYYAELLGRAPTLANHRRLPSDERSCPNDVPSIRHVDGPLARHIQTLLDAVADISLCQRGNVSATMACLKYEKGTLETRLYVAFNHEDDEAARRCPLHLPFIFEMLRQVPYKPPEMDGSRKVIAEEVGSNLIEICRAIHNYSFDVYAHRVSKHKDKLSDIRGYIEQDRTHFAPWQRPMLVEFLRHVDAIIRDVANAQDTKKLPTTSIKMLLGIYSYWTGHNLLPKDNALADNKVTLLDTADQWLADEHRIGVQLRRWALKIMSLVISAIRLFVLTQSPHLRTLFEGKFVVQVLRPPATVPYCCTLSSETIRVALDAALAGTPYLSAYWDKKRESFIEQLLSEPEVSEVVVRRKPTVHAELAMIIEMDKGTIEHVLPYIGVSKLSCIMCSHYMRAFNEVSKQRIATKSSHGKAYPGWFWPSLPSCDRELRPAFLRQIRRQLVSDFKQHAESTDSSVGSGDPEWHLGVTRDDILELLNACIAE